MLSAMGEELHVPESVPGPASGGAPGATSGVAPTAGARPPAPEADGAGAAKDPAAAAWARRVASFLAARGLGPGPLASTAVAVAGLAGVLLLLGHPRLAGGFALAALLLSELSLARPEATGTGAALAFVLAPAVDLLVAGGLVARAANASSDALALLALLVLLLVAWLPTLDGARGDAGPRGLWLRADRLGVLALACLLDRILLGLVLVAAVGLLDAWVGLSRHARPGVDRAPRFLAPLLDARGSLLPVARWGSLVVAALLLVAVTRF